MSNTLPNHLIQLITNTDFDEPRNVYGTQSPVGDAKIYFTDPEIISDGYRCVR